MKPLYPMQTMQLRKPLAFMLVAASAILPEQSQAAAVKQNLNVSVTVNYGCNLQVTDMDFGTVHSVTGSETATSNVTVNCTPGALFLLSFAPSSWTTSRASAMANAGGAKINFNMSLAASLGFGSTSTTINGQLVATSNPQTGAYKSVETLYVIY